MTKSNTLIHLLSDGRFHSGEELGQQLRVTRSAVWKEIKQLTQLGLDIHRVHGKGYCIPGGIELFAADKIKACIAPRLLPHLHHLEILDAIDSTNRYLLDKLKQGAPLTCGDVCLAEYQTAGR